MVLLVVVAVEQGQSLDVVPLALGLAADALGALDRPEAVGHGFRRRRRGERIAARNHGDAPVRHGAAWVLLCDLLEGVAGRREPEGMQEGDGPVEGGLRLGRAGHLEAGLADPAGYSAFMRERGRRNRKGAYGSKRGARDAARVSAQSHDVPPECKRKCLRKRGEYPRTARLPCLRLRREQSRGCTWFLCIHPTPVRDYSRARTGSERCDAPCGDQTSSAIEP